MAARMKQEDAIEAVLKKHEPLSCKDIVYHIQKENLAKLGGNTPINTVRACMIRAPTRFVRVDAGMYALKTKSVPPIDDKAVIEYQYTEKLFKIPNGKYYQMRLNDVIYGIVVEKPHISKALKIAYPDFTNDKFPCIYVLNANGPQKKIYVGETYEALVRLGRWNSIKNYAQAAIIYAPRLASTNIRKNIERVVMETFEEMGWETENKTKSIVDVGPEEEYPYDQIKKIVPVVANKIITIFETLSDTDGFTSEQTEDPIVLDKKVAPPRETWSETYYNADPAVRDLVTKANQTIKSVTSCLTFESAWLYFADGKAARKQSFAALRIIGKKKLDLVFLSPEIDVLPENARRVKPFVLSHNSECRLRLDQTNIKDVGEIAAKSRYYMRSEQNRQ